jgi:hypothetical protein
VCRAVVAIESYEGPSKKSESAEARYPDIILSDLRLAIATLRKSGKTEKPVLEFRCCTPNLVILNTVVGPGDDGWVLLPQGRNVFYKIRANSRLKILKVGS